MSNVMGDLNVGFVQCQIEWEKTTENLQRYTEIISGLDHKPDLLVFPEMFHCGFTMDPLNVAQTMDGEVVSWMKETASVHQMAIAGSVVIVENNLFFNRFIFAGPDGRLHVYDKRHLFRMAGEHQVYQMGHVPCVVSFKGWRINLLVCYDLRFPVWSRNRQHYDLAIYVANWPSARQEAWDVLLRARAIENQCYVLGVNRIGRDNSVGYSGGSVMVDPKGVVIEGGKTNEDTVYFATLNVDSLMKFKEKFPAFLDADDFSIFLT